MVRPCSLLLRLALIGFVPLAVLSGCSSEPLDVAGVDPTEEPSDIQVEPDEDSAVANETPEEAPEPIGIGSDAPTLEIEHWYGPEGAKTVSFDGQVTVVEFWATWCPPCVASMPHLAELQTELGQEGLRIVSISDEPPETVNAFLERPVRGSTDEEDAPTYAELTSAYDLTSDPDGSSTRDYMQAAGQGGIPTAFVVGKTGQIEWIGHPMEMDEPVRLMLSDQWDREAYAAEFERKKQRELAQRAIMRSMRSGDFDAVQTQLDEMDASDDPALREMAEQLRPFVRTQKFFMTATQDPAAAVEQFPELLESISDNPLQVNQFAWQVFQMSAGGAIDSPELLQMAADATEAALVDDESKASLLDTIGHLYHVKGDLDRAIEFQTRAAEAVGETTDEQLAASIDGFLAELLAEKAAAEADKAETEAAETAEEAEVEIPLDDLEGDSDGAEPEAESFEPDPEGDGSDAAADPAEAAIAEPT